MADDKEILVKKDGKPEEAALVKGRVEAKAKQVAEKVDSDERERKRLVTVEKPKKEPEPPKEPEPESKPKQLQEPEKKFKAPIVIKLPNASLSMSITQSEDGQTLMLRANGKELELVQGKTPIVKDHNGTGRTMIRVYNPNTHESEKEVLYDPLSGKLLSYHERHPIPKDEHISLAKPEELAETVAEAIAENVEEDVKIYATTLHSVNFKREFEYEELDEVRALGTNKQFYVDRIEVDDEDPNKDVLVVKTTEKYEEPELVAIHPVAVKADGEATPVAPEPEVPVEAKVVEPPIEAPQVKEPTETVRKPADSDEEQPALKPEIIHTPTIEEAAFIDDHAVPVADETPMLKSVRQEPEGQKTVPKEPTIEPVSAAVVMAPQETGDKGPEEKKPKGYVIKHVEAVALQQATEAAKKNNTDVYEELFKIKEADEQEGRPERVRITGYDELLPEHVRSTSTYVGYNDRQLEAAARALEASPNEDIARLAAEARRIATSADVVPASEAADELADLARDARQIRAGNNQAELDALSQALREGRARARQAPDAAPAPAPGGAPPPAPGRGIPDIIPPPPPEAPRPEPVPAPEAAPRPEAAPGGRRRRDRQSNYYERQEALQRVAPTPDFIGFESTEEYETRSGEFIDPRRQIEPLEREYNLLGNFANDPSRKFATEIRENRYISVPKIDSDGSERLTFEQAFALNRIRIVQNRQYRGANGEMIEEVLPRPLLVYTNEQGRVDYDRPLRVVEEITFDPSSADGRRFLIALQYTELEYRQKRWIDENLRKISESAETTESFQRNPIVGRIEQARSNLLATVEPQYDMMFQTFLLKNLHKNGLAAFERGNHNIYAHYVTSVMRMPGVVEAFAELERRAAAMYITPDEKNPGMYRALLKGEKEAAKRRLLTVDGEQRPERASITDITNLVDQGELYSQIKESITEISRENWFAREKQLVEQSNDDVIKKAARLAYLDGMKNSKQLVDRTTFEIAEGLWRMFGRSGYFYQEGPIGGNGENEAWTAINPGYVAAAKSRGSKQMRRTAFGYEEKEEALEVSIPGQAQGQDLHTGMQDFLTQYFVFSPGYASGVKQEQYFDAGVMRQTRDPKDMEIVREIWERRKAKGPDGDAELLRSLTKRQKLALDNFNMAPVPVYTREMLYSITDKSSGIDFGENWTDFPGEMTGAAKITSTLTDHEKGFLKSPDPKFIPTLAEAMGHRKRDFAKRAVIKRAVESLVAYGADHRKEAENKRNFDADDIDRIVTSAERQKFISDYQKEQIEDEQLGKLRLPVLLFAKNRAVLDIPAPAWLKRYFIIWPGKHKNKIVFPMIAFFDGFMRTLFKTFGRGIGIGK